MMQVKRYWAQGLFGQFVSHIRYIPMAQVEREKAIEAQRKGLCLPEPDKNNQGPKK